MKILFYTFKNFPWKNKFKKIKFFEFKKLKEDLLEFESIYNENMPIYIIGIAKSRNTSFFETKTVNSFNKNKKISKFGKDVYTLTYPIKGFSSIKLNHGYTDSFCNWTMYKISEIINDSQTKLQFVHITKSDTKLLNEYLVRL